SAHQYAVASWLLSSRLRASRLSICIGVMRAADVLVQIGWPNAAATGPRKQRTETATGFKKEIRAGSQGGRRTPKVLRSVRAVGWARRQRLILDAKGQLARKGRILNPGCPVYFSGMTRR